MGRRLAGRSWWWWRGSYFFLPLERFGRLAKGGRREVCGVEMWLRVVNWRVDQLLAYRSFACLFLSGMLAPGDGFRYGPFFASPGVFPFGLSPQFDGSYLSLSHRRMFHLHEMVHHSLLTARTSSIEGDSAGFFSTGCRGIDTSRICGGPCVIELVEVHFTPSNTASAGIVA